MLFFRCSRINRNTSHYENLIRQDSQPVFRAESLDSPVRPPRKKDSFYQSMNEDNSIDSDGSNVTTTISTTGD
jgi:hypothetical protein